MALFLRCLAVIFVLLGAYPGAMAATDPGFLAKVYDQESNKQKLLFTYKHESESKGEARLVTNTYNDKDGTVAAVETVEFVKAGDAEAVRSYKMSQKQLGAEGSLEVRDGKAFFTYTKNGKTKKAEEKIGDDFVVGPSISSYLQRNWATIQGGGKVKIRLGVLDRVETVGFEFFKDREETVDGKKAFVLKMKPSSFLIAALVKPLYFFYTPDGQTLLEVHGRTQVKQKVEGSWADLDAVTVYEYTSSSAANSK